MCIRQRIGGSNPPLTAIFKMRARTKVRAFFFYILRKGGDENPRPGFDNWRQPVGQTESEANRLPVGRAKRVNPPLTAIFKMRARTKVRAFFFYILRKGGDENPRPGFDNWRQPVGQTESEANRLPVGRAKRVNPPLTLPLSPGERKVLLFHHPRILFGQKIHQRPDRRQQAAPRRINRVNHFPSGFPRVEHPYQFP